MALIELYTARDVQNRFFYFGLVFEKKLGYGSE